MEIQKVTAASQIYILAELAYEIWPECYSEILSNAQIEYMLDKFLSEKAIDSQIKEQGYEYYFITENSSILGFTGINTDENALFLSKLYIRKSVRGKGYGKEVLSFLEQLCKSRGLKYIYLTVNKNNTSAISIYKKAGFSIENDLCSDIGGGYIMDDYMMKKYIV